MPENLFPLKEGNVVMKECQCGVVEGKEGTTGDPGVSVSLCHGGEGQVSPLQGVPGQKE